ncbi:ATPase AAA domain-containing protein 2 [Phlyctochytrium bullatum]|nr:ATPase AAA domain-containing protein 2 [Phlyctochytrium bullatum]
METEYPTSESYVEDSQVQSSDDHPIVVNSEEAPAAGKGIEEKISRMLVHQSPESDTSPQDAEPAGNGSSDEAGEQVPEGNESGDGEDGDDGADVKEDGDGGLGNDGDGGDDDDEDEDPPVDYNDDDDEDYEEHSSRKRRKMDGKSRSSKSKRRSSMPLRHRPSRDSSRRSSITNGSHKKSRISWFFGKYPPTPDKGQEPVWLFKAETLTFAGGQSAIEETRVKVAFTAFAVKSTGSSGMKTYDSYYITRRTRSSGAALEDFGELPSELLGRRSNQRKKESPDESMEGKRNKREGASKGQRDADDDEEDEVMMRPRLRLVVASPAEGEGEEDSPPSNKRKRDDDDGRDAEGGDYGGDGGDGGGGKRPRKNGRGGDDEDDDSEESKKDDKDEDYKDEEEEDDDDDDEMSVAEEEEPISPPTDETEDDGVDDVVVDDEDEDDYSGRPKRLTRKRDAHPNGDTPSRRNLRPRNRNGATASSKKLSKSSSRRRGSDGLRSLRAFVVDDDDDGESDNGKGKKTGGKEAKGHGDRPPSAGGQLPARGIVLVLTDLMKDDDDDLQGTTPKRRGGGGGGPPSARIGGQIEPLNIAELIRAQESAILKDLPPEEREKFEKEARLFRTSAKDLADTDPVATSQVSFDAIGGLEDHIRSLKEMVVMPLLYPEIFAGFQITAPRGVLFYGPPGTGKTLMGMLTWDFFYSDLFIKSIQARALASSCSTATQKVAFFMRKGADVLSKWVGESERQLRLLFEQAKTYQPSIIFFDEIDGLAPVRSSKQDQIHASIVSTLLALMDGLDSRGQVVVIGATNRIDAIDPALRRPGRFDRELFFPLPAEDARLKILRTATSKWNPQVDESLLVELSKATRGYCGADVKALCTEAALCAVRRSYPEIYESGQKLQIAMEDIKVIKEDFLKSMKSIIPSTQRSSNIYSNPIPAHIYPLVSGSFARVLAPLDVLAPLLTKMAAIRVEEFAGSDFGHSTTGTAGVASSFVPPSSSSSAGLVQSRRHAGYVKSLEPRLIISGAPGMGQKLLGPATLERLEAHRFYVQSLDLASLLGDPTRTPEAAIVQLMHELKRHRPAVVYIPEADVWWETVQEAARNTLVSLLERDPMDPVLVLATTEKPFRELPEGLKRMVHGRLGNLGGVEGWTRVIEVAKPNEEHRRAFFHDLIEHVRTPPSGSAPDTEATAVPRRRDPLPLAPEPAPRQLSEAEIDAIVEHDDALRRQLRMELRFIVNDIKRQKRFSEFQRPVDPDVYPDYYKVVTRPMDFETLIYNINNDKYAIVEQFIADFECIMDSAEEYNEPGSAIVQKASDLYDVFMMYINTLKRREPEFVWELKQSALRRKLVDRQRRLQGLPPIFSDDEEEAPASAKPAVDAAAEDGANTAPAGDAAGEEQQNGEAAPVEGAEGVEGAEPMVVDGGEGAGKKPDWERMADVPLAAASFMSLDTDGGMSSPNRAEAPTIPETGAVVDGVSPTESMKIDSDAAPPPVAPTTNGIVEANVKITVSDTGFSIDSLITAPSVPASLTTEATVAEPPANPVVPPAVLSANLTDLAEATLALTLTTGAAGPSTTTTLQPPGLPTASSVLSTSSSGSSAAGKPPSAGLRTPSPPPPAPRSPATPPPPPRQIELDPDALFELERRLVHATRGRSVAEMEGLGVALGAVAERLENEWDRNVMVKELHAVLDRAIAAWEAAAAGREAGEEE